MAQNIDLPDISEMFSYYDQSRKKGKDIDVGEVVFTPVLNTERKPTIADASRSDPHNHTRADFNIRQLDENTDYRGKPGRLPIKALHLSQNEEVVVSRSKKRPCIVLAKTDGIDHKTLPEGPQRNKALNSFDRCYCLAPIYSVSAADKARSFGPVMTARVKCMMYPEFVFIPQSGLIIKNPGVIRLDRMFWSHLMGATDVEDLFVSTEVLGIVWNQIRILSGETPFENYTELRDLLLSYLPEDCQ